MDVLKSLTPETFNVIIVAALGLSVMLGGWRFYKDMQRSPRAENDDELYLSDMRRFYVESGQSAVVTRTIPPSSD